MTAQELLLKHGIKLPDYGPGRHYTTCPQCSRDRSCAHQNNKVLGVTIEADGSVRWGCNHCNWTGPQKGNGGYREELKAYFYRDREGRVLFRKVRNLPGKTPRFWLERSDGNGGWRTGTKDVDTKVIYRADEVAKAIAEGRTIACVEGEKDADNLWRIGIAATCNAHGASEPGKASKWKSEHSAQLKSADIVVFNDNDAAGYEHAEATCKLSLGIAKSVRRLDLAKHWEAIPKGGDVSDWLEKGDGTEARLRELIEQAPEYTKKAEQDPSPPPGKNEYILAELNRENIVVLDGGKVWVLRFEEVTHNLNGRRYSYRVPTYLRTGDFRALYMNRCVKVGDRFMDLGQWWLKHPARRQYFGLVFEPGGEHVVDGKLNLWTGWGVEPKRGDWSLMRKHISEVLAAGDQAVDTYIVNWLAWAVQNPDQQPETALAFLGKRGSGRGTLGNAMCLIFGNHGLHITSTNHLVGRFNAHLRQCGFLFADEAYVVADRSAEGRLKGLITEPTIPVEGKGKDVITVANHLHVMMASNEDWVVPAGEIERRFVVQEVADDHAQKEAWFKPLYEQLNAGGLEAMLFDLLNHDLGDWHPRNIVRTTALAAQQAKSLSPFDAWWEDLLHDGYLPAGDAFGQVISGDYRVRKSDGYFTDDSKKTWFEKRKGLFEQARTSSPRLKNETDAAFGRYLGKRKCVRKRVCRQRGWQFPPLDKARAEWLTRFPDTVWDQRNVTSWEGERDDDDDVV